ncbi:helix-turn-helix transcriptional regulator [Streptomyces sp. NPDC026672]|uniref:helix-turn-helix transcriptional regulator n=1 Tax=unclassified Streptomyces TaxID=2593676 RepID=UPI0033F5314B
MTHPYARELGEFLRARRDRLRPQDVGLELGGRRKVSGLRREEIALLAGLSTDYYQRMEQGREMRPSDEVLTALADALGLDEDESRYFFTLARAARQPMPERVERQPEWVPTSTQRLLAAIDVPALVLGRHLDVLEWNLAAEALFGDFGDYPRDRLNLLMLMFDDAHIRESGCKDWEHQAQQYIALMRASIATDPTHPRARAVIGELSIRSPEFRRLWALHDVSTTTSGEGTFHAPDVGDITLDWDTYPLPGNPGPMMLVFTAEPDSSDADRLRLLASLYASRSRGDR